MCGIAGILDSSLQSSAEKLQTDIINMTNTIVHRGPNGEGFWIDENVGIALGHRRIAINDFSSDGQQPVFFLDGCYVISFDGEIYNHKQLRISLENEGYRFRGNSAIEVALASIHKWGLEGAVSRFVGMFAFALWDIQKRQLHLVRDRLGEKPLYYGWVGERFLFASELKALHACSTFKADIDRNALALYLRHNCIPAPYSIYKGIYKLLPGSIITITSVQAGVYPEPHTYWSLRDVAETGNNNRFKGTDKEAIAQLDKLLKESVRYQMISDVPLGAFLSGGIDSSTIVALMQSQSNRPVKTFTIGLGESAYNEAENANAIARYLGTEHTELYLSPKDVMNVIPKLPILYDEPFADSSQIPTFLVAQLARQQVAVCLSGDGGDELFGGYNRHVWVPRIWNKIGWMPLSLRRGMARSLHKRSPAEWDGIFQRLQSVLPEKYKQRLPGDKLHKLASILDAINPQMMYYSLVSHWKDAGYIVKGAEEPLTIITDEQKWALLEEFSEQMMYLDISSYLPDDGLVKVERACMGVSLESRSPYLDHRVVEFAWQLPISMKIREGKSKWILRQVLYQYVPSKFIDRPKMGFGIPIDNWLRGPLREWAEELLSESRLREEGFFQTEPIRQKWQEHLSGKRNWQHHLWDVLMFEAWLDSNKV